MKIVEVTKHDVYSDGEINNAVVRTSKFVFKDEYEGRQFMAKVFAAEGVIEVKDITQKTHTKYLVATAMGGIMESPELYNENEQIIIANSDEEARDIYDSKYSCYYFTATILTKLGSTTENITNSEPINDEEEEAKQAWLKKK